MGGPFTWRGEDSGIHWLPGVFDPPELQLLYGLLPEYCGQGLAGEIASAAIDYGFDTLKFTEIVGATDQPNVASSRVMEKLGMNLFKQEDHDGQPTLFYRISAEEWRQR